MNTESKILFRLFQLTILEWLILLVMIVSGIGSYTLFIQKSFANEDNFKEHIQVHVNSDKRLEKKLDKMAEDRTAQITASETRLREDVFELRRIILLKFK